jgi:hypothetical protein
MTHGEQFFNHILGVFKDTILDYIYELRAGGRKIDGSHICALDELDHWQNCWWSF